MTAIKPGLKYKDEKMRSKSAREFGERGVLLSVAKFMKLLSRRFLAPVRIAYLSQLSASLLWVAGCTTPDLKPFAEATGTLKSAVKQAGDLTIEQLTRQTITLEQKTFFPGDTNHPAMLLKASWNNRQRTMDAVASYSASLTAIADATAKRKANATQVVGAVKDLALNFGFSAGISAAGELLVTIGSTIIEVKAFHDMSRSVEAAQPVIDAVADAVEKDFRSLALEYESLMRKQIRQLKNQGEKSRKYYTELLQKREDLRGQGAGIADDAAQREMMNTLDKLVAGVAPEVTENDRELAIQATALKDGLQFYAEAGEVMAVWRTAHEDLHRALQENRTPNLAVLVSRAQELKDLANKLRNEKP